MLAMHGRWKIKVINNVLIQWFADSWNEEAIVEHIKEFKAAAMPLTQGEWAIISIFEQWELGIPEIEAHVAEACDWFKQHGCVKDCHVYCPNSIKEMQLEKMIPCSSPGYERCIFDNVNSALLWLDSQGFHLNPDEVLAEHESFLNEYQQFDSSISSY